jgi:Zn-dependent protease with chaperone function
MTQSSTQQCPKCHTEIPIDPGYPVWCDHCEWNLYDHKKGLRENLYQKFYFKVSSRLGERLLSLLTHAGPSLPTFSFSKLLAFVIAGLVYVFVLAQAAFGISLIRDGYQTDLFSMLIGVLWVGMAFIMRPRIYAVPKRNIITRDDFPTLYKITDEVASLLGTKRVDLILITTRFNASFFRAGWLRKNILHLGMPLFELLTPQERVALIAHELAHSANGDASRSFFIASAIQALRAWHNMLNDKRTDQITILMSLYFIIPRLIASILRLIATILELLLASDSQRAEYLADNMSARAGGTQASLSLLHKLLLADSLETKLGSFYEIGGTQGVFEALRRKAAHVPPRELERAARVERSLASRLDATHPPIAYRIELLQTRSALHPEVVVSTQEIEAIERELSQIRPSLEVAMLHDYQDRADY